MVFPHLFVKAYGYSEPKKMPNSVVRMYIQFVFPTYFQVFALFGIYFGLLLGICVCNILPFMGFTHAHGYMVDVNVAIRCTAG